MSVPSDILYKHWGFSSFRPFQEDIINEVIAGRDTLALLPTGGGKSICYQIPGLILDGICIVVSPLIALMNDQLAGLRSKGIVSESINAQVSKKNIDRILDNCIYGNVKFLFIAPERISNELFRARISKMKVGLIAVDEAHCISQWGHEFRPAYRTIAEIRELRPNTPIIALTATATPEVAEDIQTQLCFENPNLIQQSFSRNNISFSVQETEDKRGALLASMRKMAEGSVIIYVRSRRRCMELNSLLNSENHSSTYYHAGLSNEKRNSAQQDWIEGKKKVIVATNAFGMGIDKADVRCVIHFDLSDSIESYYQEAGRAGRDGERSVAIQLYNQSDITDTRKMVLKGYPDISTVKHVYQVMSDRLGLAAGSGTQETFGIDLAELSRNSKVDMVTTLGSLKCLELNGYVQLHRGLKEPSRIQMKLEQARLLSLQNEENDMAKLIHNLMRHRTGLYSSPVVIREEELATLCKMPIKSIEVLLHKAHLRGILEYLPRKGTSSLTYILPRQYERDLRLDAKLMNQVRERTLFRQNSLIHYLRNQLDCRMVQLLAYFGEERIQICGACDICSNQDSLGSSIDKNELLQSMRKALRSEMDLNRIKSEFSLHEPKRAAILRWSIDKGFIQVDNNKMKWTGPQIKLSKSIALND
ncbi:MAG: RecQ family ATP-dependent DNA helicase [Flavobacteriales bacterium]|nr:RecQ family ATP-dependent DNA helicase [Flavobacteriales bacterium]